MPHHIVGKAKHEKRLASLSLIPRDCSSKLGFQIQLTHRGAMAALHIIGINFQLWFGEHTGIGGEQQVVVALVPESLSILLTKILPLNAPVA